MNIFKWMSSCAGTNPLSRPLRPVTDGLGSQHDRQEAEDAAKWPHVSSRILTCAL